MDFPLIAKIIFYGSSIVVVFAKGHAKFTESQDIRFIVGDRTNETGGMRRV
jgi:hypothetical protein